MDPAAGAGGATPEAVLYLVERDDARAAAAVVAGRPVAFRTLMAALRAGLRRVGVPAVFRGTEIERAIARTPAARAATIWLTPESPAPADGRVLLLPAAALLSPSTIVTSLAASPPSSSAGPAAFGGGPAALVGPGAAVTPGLWASLASGRPIGPLVQAAVREGRIQAHGVGGATAELAAADAARHTERALYAGLGSPLDTRVDTMLHRRASRWVTRAAVACGITPNVLTLASLLVGVVAAWCFAQPAAAAGLAGLLLYAVSVVLDHADGEVARLTLTETRFGEWLDVVADTAVHALVVLAIGVTAEMVAGDGSALFGLVAATGVLASAALAKLWPPRPAVGLGALLHGLSNRNGFYAMLAAFIAVRALAPGALPAFMLLVALGLHAYWIGAVTARVVRRTP